MKQFFWLVGDLTSPTHVGQFNILMLKTLYSTRILSAYMIGYLAQTNVLRTPSHF